MTTPDLYADLPPGSRRPVTFALLACAFLGMLDGTVVGTALPRIVEQVGGSRAWYVWLVTAMPFLIAGRALQGVGAGALLTGGFLFQLAALPAGVLLPLYLQQVRGHSATVSGLLLLPLLVGMVVGNRVTAALILRSGRAKPVLLAGAGLLAAGSAAFFTLGQDTSAALTGAWLLLIGLGTGPAMGGLTIATQNSVPRADLGTATAGSMLTKQLGGSFGLTCAQSPIGGTRITAAGVGGTIGRLGTVAGLLALAALLAMRETTVPSPALSR
ncbi:MFS transporter [Nonomuraea gerenzanensis]|uniref:Multidrug resistance protein B n=1 Tax=Nonomuraea gerenzanensis TaxID=93944 RepID=A0A1M4EDW1_9ACTN|nr:MFS transporter [Nonomuraea gerenzanensis]UBU08640.1 MFS transporter [Nonomuraea gerenzanensis]SBO97000.1 multidrug resistance protein B [Nonomuraea gerenzanensis]